MGACRFLLCLFLTILTRKKTVSLIFFSLNFIFSPSSNEHIQNSTHFCSTLFALLCFWFLPFSRFLTKREQQLMQRRHHAEELLQWKERLDQEEAEVRRIEKEALAVWNTQQPQAEDIKAESPIHSLSHHQSQEPRPDSEKGEATGQRKAHPVWTTSDILTVYLSFFFFINIAQSA